MAFVGSFMDEAVALNEEARAAFDEEGQLHAAARVSARIGEVPCGSPTDPRKGPS